MADNLECICPLEQTGSDFDHALENWKVILNEVRGYRITVGHPKESEYLVSWVCGVAVLVVQRKSQEIRGLILV